MLVIYERAHLGEGSDKVVDGPLMREVGAELPLLLLVPFVALGPACGAFDVEAGDRRGFWCRSSRYKGLFVSRLRGVCEIKGFF